MIPQSVKISILLFYTYVEPLWSPARQQTAIDLAIKQVRRMNIFFVVELLNLSKIAVNRQLIVVHASLSKSNLAAVAL